MARSRVSRGIQAPSALSMMARNRGLSAGSPPPLRADTVNSRISLVKILPRLASCAALRCLILAHLLCPAMYHLKTLSAVLPFTRLLVCPLTRQRAFQFLAYAHECSGRAAVSDRPHSVPASLRRLHSGFSETR